MKFSINAVLTTLVGGHPVTTDTSTKALNKLLDENMQLNARLPFVKSRELTKEELLEANIEVKRERIYELCPALREGMGEEIEVASASLRKIISLGGGVTPEYVDICKIVLRRAQTIVNGKTVDLDFEHEDLM